MEGVDSFCRTAAYVTRDEFMLCLFDLPDLSVWESGNNISLITLSIALLV